MKKGDRCQYKDVIVTVVNSSTKNTRVQFPDGSQTLVPTEELKSVAEIVSIISDNLGELDYSPLKEKMLEGLSIPSVAEESKVTVESDDNPVLKELLAQAVLDGLSGVDPAENEFEQGLCTSTPESIVEPGVPVEMELLVVQRQTRRQHLALRETKENPVPGYPKGVIRRPDSSLR